VKCFLNYCKAHPEEVDLLFHMLSILTVRSTIDFTSLRDFYSQKVAEEYNPQQKKNIMMYFLERFFPSDSFTQDHKVQALQTLIIPMLSASLGNDSKDIIEPATVSAIVHKVLGHQGGDVPHGPSDEALSIELLQLATLLVRFMPNELVEHRKELIKFAWNHLKSEDTTSRQCAYVLVCRFIEAYDTPPKIILQVYVALLRAFQPEARSLVRQALDILTPALRKRVS
jgi:transformation/transcription domain-associated protein